MKVTNQIHPSEQQMQSLIEPGHDKPIYMVNLLKFNAKAEYPDGRETDITGAQAFDLYSEAVAKILLGLGGAPLFSASIESIWLGEVEEPWDAVVIAKYPNKKAMYDMLASPEYQEAAIHRTAGLAGQINMETTHPVGLWPMQRGDS
ncbi:MAG: DUF1330 domain-containing protein [Halieaceae bacterium]|nr:DUF1330 domain-containing protein [Halieaceae bacterium]